MYSTYFPTVIEAIRPLHPTKIWDDISPQFLTTFWSLTMYDLFVPETVYEREIAKLKAAPAKVDENKDLNSARKKKEKERLNNLLDKMTAEQKLQKDHVDRVLARYSPPFMFEMYCSFIQLVQVTRSQVTYSLFSSLFFNV